MSYTDKKLKSHLMSYMTQSSVISSIVEFNDNKMEAIHAHEISFIEKYLFPLLIETNRATSPSTILKTIEYLFLAFQIYFIGTFNFLHNSASTKEFDTVNMFFFLGFSGDFDNFFSQMIVLIALHLLTFLFLMITSLTYTKKHEVPHLITIIIRIWDGSLYNILIIPTTIFFFATFGLNGESSTPVNISYCFLSIVCMGLSIFHFFYLTGILNRSPYLSNNIINIWRPNEFYYMILSFSFSAGLGIFVKNFSLYIHIIPPILYICTFPFFIFQFLYDNFSNIFFNALFFSVPISGSLSAIFSIVNIVEQGLIGTLPFYLTPLILLILLIIISSIVIYFRRKSITNQLKYPSPNMDTEQKEQYISTLGIDTVMKAFMYLENGIENASDLLIDWSLHSYLVKNFSNCNELLTVLAWYAAFFPSETHLMHAFILKASKMINPSIYDKALFVQLHRVHIFRQSSAIKEANIDYKRLHSLTERLIGQYTNFWANIQNASYEFSDDLYERMTILRLEADSSWAEVIDKYPNNSRFAYEYSKYLIEGRCRYKMGFKWLCRAKALEKGKKLEHDQIFLHLIRMYPIYIKRNVIDNHGNLTPEHKNNNSVSATTSASDLLLFQMNAESETRSSNSYDDEDSDIQSIPQTQLKLALERSVNVLSSPNINKIWISAIIRLILMLAYSAICFGIVSSLFHDKDRFFDCFRNYARSTHNLWYSLHNTFWFWVQSFDSNLLSYSSLSDFIGPTFYFYNNNFETNLSQLIYEITSQSLDYYSQMSFETYKEDVSSSDELINFTAILSNELIDNNFCIDDRIIIPNRPTQYFFNTKTEPQSITTDFLFRYTLTNILNLSLQTDSQRQQWSHDNDFCALIFQHWNLFNHLNYLVENIIPLYSTVIEEYFSHNYTSPYLFERNSTLNTTKIPTPYSQASDEIDSNDFSRHLDLITNIIIAFTPLVCMSLIFPLVIFLSVGVNHEWEEYTDLLKQFPPSECEKASTVIRHNKKVKGNANQNAFIQDGNNFVIPTWLPNFISSFIVIIVLLALGLSSRTQVQNITYTVQKFVLETHCHNSIYQIGTDALFLIHMISVENGQYPEYMSEYTVYMNASNFTENLERELDIFTIASNVLSYGGPTLPGSIGQRTGFEDIKLDERCDSNYDSQFSIDFYNCISYENLIMYYTQFIRAILNSPSHYTLQSSFVYNIAFLLRTRLFTDFEEIMDRYDEIYNEKRSNFMLLATIFLVVSIIACVIAFIFDFLVIDRISNSLETFKDIALRIDPIAFVTNHRIISLIYGKGKNSFKKITSATHAIYNISNDGIVSINHNKAIETLNPASSRIFGFTQEQMLGQQISVFIPENLRENSEFYSQIKLMTEGQAPSLIYNGDVIGVKDNDLHIPLKITLLGYNSTLIANKILDSNNNNVPKPHRKLIFSRRQKYKATYNEKHENEELEEMNNYFKNGAKIADTFDIIFKDMTEENELKLAMETAKKQSESLLFQMLPQTIISKKADNGEVPSYTVNSASVLFINIEKFSFYVSSMNPSEILKNIKLIVESYDALLKKYFLLTKIKVIGDCYMVGSGIFDNEASETLHSNQALFFSLDCLDAIEDINMKLTSNLQIRIGISSGGPIIATVFGNEKPVFDIIGEPIQIAAKLQTTGIPGTVHISQDTYNFIATNVLDIENSEPITVFDKTIPTYCVHQRARLYHESASELFKQEDLNILNQQFISPDNVNDADDKQHSGAIKLAASGPVDVLSSNPNLPTIDISMISASNSTELLQFSQQDILNNNNFDETPSKENILTTKAINQENQDVKLDNNSDQSLKENNIKGLDKINGGEYHSDNIHTGKKLENNPIKNKNNRPLTKDNKNKTKNHGNKGKKHKDKIEVVSKNTKDESKVENHSSEIGDNTIGDHDNKNDVHDIKNYSQTTNSDNIQMNKPGDKNENEQSPYMSNQVNDNQNEISNTLELEQEFAQNVFEKYPELQDIPDLLDVLPVNHLTESSLNVSYSSYDIVKDDKVSDNRTEGTNDS